MAADSALLVSLVEEFVTGLQDSKANDTATGVQAKKFTILQLVEALGPSLTSNTPHTRARGVQLLSLVIQQCYGDLSESEVEVLIAFYENRLKDHYVIIPFVLQGLKALTKSSLLPAGSAVSMLRSLFQDTHVQSLMLAERATVYNMLLNLMESREAELKGLGADFVFGFVQSMDGERDPRNLVLAFQIANNIIHRGYDLGKFAEELFEVTSCYFPVDFSPPPNDPHGITQETLILSLRAVLAGTPRFAEFLLPLIIEKLDSDIQSAKIDSLQTLTACLSTYEHKDLAEFLSGLWTSIRREVFQTASERVEGAGLAALTALTSCLSRAILSSDSEDSLNAFLDVVLKDCQHHLSEPDLKLVWPSAKLLQAACSASYRASHIVAAVVIPGLVEQYNSRTQCAHRRTILEVLQGFIHTVKNTSQSEDDGQTVLLAQRDALCAVVFSALAENNSDLQVTSMRVLSALGQQNGLLLESDVERAVDHLNRLILEEDDSKVSVSVIVCAESLSRLHPTVFITKMVPTLKQQIFSEPMVQGDGCTPSNESSQHAVRQRCVSALAAVSTQPSVVRESAPVLLEVLKSAHTGRGGFSVDEVVAVCFSLQRIADQALDSEETGRFFHDIIIPRLLTLALQAALQGEGSPGNRSPLVEEAVLSAMVGVISSACAKLQPELAGKMASRAVSLFLEDDVSFLSDNSLPPHIQLLKQGGSWCCSQTVCLLMACVCSLPRSVEVPQVERLMEQLEELSITCGHVPSYTSAAKCYAGLVNKRPAGDSLNALIQRSTKRVSSELDSPASPHRTQAFTLLLWLAKGLLLRYHPLSTALTDKLFALLGDRELGPMVGDGFSLLMSDSADVLNRGCHADVRIMYRQRFFTENSAKLLQGFNSAAPDTKSSYLKALSHLVSSLPKEVQLTELPALLSLLLEALSCPDQGVQLSTLSCLVPVLTEPPPALIQQLEALVSRLLALTCSPTMTVRIESLRCLHAMSRFPEHEVIPLRARVLRALAKPLDDRKRLVRSVAVQARADWFLLGSPGGR
ncbi:MMS19 nucleotide excision repair protein homolog isoform X1 [Gadus macrocephalus]|uniref:MMS19 nucleotide excision repair protein homolog isoform X1 n=1 Tax=Gadus macrocephalus TaxID=80720 RepID=UPI0028CB4511|nr:MMS19 nucleotide excision repair protein homolog isoform X1 [Gadus macrocephalus]